MLLFTLWTVTSQQRRNRSWTYLYLRTIPSLLNWFNHFYYLFFNFFSSFLKSSFSLFSFLCLYIPFSSVYKLSLIRCPIIYNTFFFLLFTATFLYCFILCKNKIYLKILFIFQMKPSEKFINSFDYSLSSSTIYIKSSCDVSFPYALSKTSCELIIIRYETPAVCNFFFESTLLVINSFVEPIMWSLCFRFLESHHLLTFSMESPPFSFF